MMEHWFKRAAAPIAPDLLAGATRMLVPVAAAYGEQLARHGPVAHSVLWRSEENQRMRFEVLAGVIEPEDDKGAITVNDFGCGYGALFDFLGDLPAMRRGVYYGYDISEDMIAAARHRIRDVRATFIHSLFATHDADYSLVSGTYNLKLDADEEAWKRYIQDSLRHLWARTGRALAFNMLSIYGAERQGGLFYADPGEFIDFCMRELTPNLTLFHDYSPIDWTIWLRK